MVEAKHPVVLVLVAVLAGLGGAGHIRRLLARFSYCPPPSKN